MMNLNLEPLSQAGAVETRLDRTSKSGLHCMIDTGYGFKDAGSARVIADKFGKPCKAIHIGYEPCGVEAVIPIRVGSFVLEMYRYLNEYLYKLLEVISIADGWVTLVVITPDIRHYSMVQTAIEKCNRKDGSPLFVKGPEKKIDSYLSSVKNTKDKRLLKALSFRGEDLQYTLGDWCLDIEGNVAIPLEGEFKGYRFIADQKIHQIFGENDWDSDDAIYGRIVAVLPPEK